MRCARARRRPQHILVNWRRARPQLFSNGFLVFYCCTLALWKWRHVMYCHQMRDTNTARSGVVAHKLYTRMSQFHDTLATFRH